MHLLMAIQVEEREIARLILSSVCFRHPMMDVERFAIAERVPTYLTDISLGAGEPLLPRRQGMDLRLRSGLPVRPQRGIVR